MFNPHLWRPWRDHANTALLEKPQRNSWQHIFGFRPPFWHAKTNTSNLAANVPKTIKKKTNKQWRSGHLVAFSSSSSSDLWSEGSGATRGVTQPAHFSTCLLHHLTFSNPTRGRAKGLSRASYQGSVWRREKKAKKKHPLSTLPHPPAPSSSPSPHQHRHILLQPLRLTLAANTRPELLFRPPKNQTFQDRGYGSGFVQPSKRAQRNIHHCIGRTQPPLPPPIPPPPPPRHPCCWSINEDSICSVFYYFSTVCSGSDCGSFPYFSLISALVSSQNIHTFKKMTRLPPPQADLLKAAAQRTKDWPRS